LVGALVTAGATTIVVVWLDVAWFAGVAALVVYLTVGMYFRLPPPPPKQN
jgi:hypothetical protein